MIPRTLAALAAVIALCHPAARGQDDAKEKAKKEAVAKELKLLEGTWEYTTVGVPGGDGDRAPMVTTSRITFRADGTFEVNHPKVKPLTGKVAIDPAVRPGKLDLTWTNSISKGKTNFGIYKLEGDTLIMALAPIGNPRPAGFAVSDGGSVTRNLRVKDKKK